MTNRATPRRILAFLLDLYFFHVAYVGAHLVRLAFVEESRPSHPLWLHFGNTVVALVVAKAAVFVLAGTYRGLPQYATVRDVVLIARNATLGSLAAFFCVSFLQGFRDFSRGVWFVDWMLTIGLLCASRLLWRLFAEKAFDRSHSSTTTTRKRVLIVGAGRAGAALAKELHAAHPRSADIVGFVDDDPEKQNATLLGRPILGTTAELPRVLAGGEVDQVIVAIPSATPRHIRRFAELARGVPEFRVIPSLDAILSGRAPIGQTLAVPPETFLPRASVDMAETRLGRFLSGKTVLVTGAGGSIGSELSRQLARTAPGGVRKLVLLDAAETPLYEIERQVRAVVGDRAVAVLASIRDAEVVREILAEHRPDIVIHAAALKHVPLAESHPLEVIATNVVATCRLADRAREAGVGHFVLVSTDKAVAPVSIMGASKRAAESYVQSLSGLGPTRFVSVRFGNVIGSSGSVVPLFHEQIARGGPVTVTDRRATRFLMTIPEASGLILHAARIARAGETYVLDMGEPVRILDLAHNMIRLYGYEPGRDIEVRYTGLRPGERLHERLIDEGEGAERTEHPKILRVGSARASRASGASVARALIALEEALARRDRSSAIGLVRALVPTYTPAGPVSVDARRARVRA